MQGINRATNAFLRYALGGEEYQAWLLGLQEMPKARTWLGGGVCSMCVQWLGDRQADWPQPDNWDAL